MRKSTRVFMIGAMLVVIGAGLFWWGATTDLQPAQGLTKADVMREIGKYAGMIGGAGIGIWIAALIMRLRGN